MVIDLDIAPELRARVERIAARSTLTPAQVIADVLDGKSLDWQEYYLDGVEAGIADANAGRFATPADFDRVLNKYRPA